MSTLLQALVFVTPAYAGDLFGMGRFFGSFVNSILVIIGLSVTLIFGWKGLRICLSRGLTDAVDEFITMAAGIAIIVGGPAISSAAIPQASGMTGLVTEQYCPLYALGDTLGWFLGVALFLSPGVLVWRLHHGQEPLDQ